VAGIAAFLFIGRRVVLETEHNWKPETWLTGNWIILSGP
jgi:hypothetical protein